MTHKIVYRLIDKRCASAFLSKHIYNFTDKTLELLSYIILEKFTIHFCVPKIQLSTATLLYSILVDLYFLQNLHSAFRKGFDYNKLP